MSIPRVYCLWSRTRVISSIDSINASDVDLLDLTPYWPSESNLCLSMNLSNLSLNSFFFSRTWRWCNSYMLPVISDKDHYSFSPASVAFTAVKITRLPVTFPTHVFLLLLENEGSCVVTKPGCLCLCECAPCHTVTVPSKHITSWWGLSTDSCHSCRGLKVPRSR